MPGPGVEQDEVGLEYTYVRSPLDGVVVRKYTQPGDLSAPGAPLPTVEHLDPLEVVAEVGESLFSRVAVGQQIEVEIPALSQAIPRPPQRPDPRCRPPEPHLPGEGGAAQSRLSPRLRAPRPAAAEHGRAARPAGAKGGPGAGRSVAGGVGGSQWPGPPALGAPGPGPGRPAGGALRSGGRPGGDQPTPGRAARRDARGGEVT
ncbi:MAG: efflux RND transporter periplasmic adaptor subunit [Candidatus Handelsmanbacteria bacterium]|nr:efflux RND transporter periplasmic adaptor subunit [Candidatus Handelsmanbacteria bacterium]